MASVARGGPGPPNAMYRVWEPLPNGGPEKKPSEPDQDKRLRSRSGWDRLGKRIGLRRKAMENAVPVTEIASRRSDFFIGREE